MDTSIPPPPAIKKSGLSTGCIVAIVLSILLVLGLGVLGIIADIAIPAGNRKVKVVTTLVTQQQMSISLKGYVVEYNRYPVSDGETSAQDCAGPWLEALLGNEPKLNPRQIVFMDISNAKRNQAGLLNLGGAHALADAWGRTMHAMMDTNSDGKLADPEHPGSVLAERVLIWSAGPDGDFNTWNDNICSWK